MKTIKQYKLLRNKKGAVSTYRFMAMYILIGVLIAMITKIGISTEDTTNAYDLSGNMERLKEQADSKDTNIEQAENAIKSDQISLTSAWGNENSWGSTWGQVFYRGLCPAGVIPWGYEASSMEKDINTLIIIFRWIIMIFAGYELFQIIWKSKTT